MIHAQNLPKLKGLLNHIRNEIRKKMNWAEKYLPEISGILSTQLDVI